MFIRIAAKVIVICSFGGKKFFQQCYIIYWHVISGNYARDCVKHTKSLLNVTNCSGFLKIPLKPAFAILSVPLDDIVFFFFAFSSKLVIKVKKIIN